MSFREKSAWVMALVLTTTGIYYWYAVGAVSREIGATAPAAVVVGFVIWVVIGSIIVQLLLVVTSPKEANAPADERERDVQQRAGNWSGVVLATGVVLSLGHYLARGDGNMLFHLAMASLIVAQIAEYAIQILLVRRSI